jgi:hypothetical protein
MWLKRSFLAALKDVVARAFTMGSDADYARLRERLGAIRSRSRRLTIAGACGFFVFAAALTATPLFLDTTTWKYRVLSALLVLPMVAAGLAAHEASRLVMLIDALEDLLFSDTSMGRLDIVTAFRNHAQADLEGEPIWEPLVAILCRAYVTTTSVQAKLLEAGIPIGYLNLGQSAAGLWRDALHAAHRGQRIEALMACILADSRVCAYHAPLRACRAQLAV